MLRIAGMAVSMPAIRNIAGEERPRVGPVSAVVVFYRSDGTPIGACHRNG
jgi:hypothetical protein